MSMVSDLRLVTIQSQFDSQRPSTKPAPNKKSFSGNDTAHFVHKHQRAVSKNSSSSPQRVIYYIGDGTTIGKTSS